MAVKNDNSILKNIKTLGIDQSLTHTGLCITCKEGEIIDAQGIATNSKLSVEERIEFIAHEIESLIKKHDIRQVVIEGIAFNARGSAITNLSGLQHVILYKLRQLKVKYRIVPPATLKKHVFGSGRAEKEEMQSKIDIADQMLLTKLSGIKLNQKKFFDIVDAYWLSRFAEF